MSVSPLQHGPLLKGLIGAQHESEAAVSYPDITRWAHALVSLSTELGDPLLMPVAGPAERLVGAAIAAARGRLRVRSLGGTLDGEHVLLVEAVAVTPLQLLQSARHARFLGATQVAACAVHLHSRGGIEDVDGFFDLASRASLLTVPAAA